MPIFYECERCAACCRWPGQVRVSEEEITRIARFLGIGEVELIQRFTRLRPDRKGLALEEKENGECVFLEGQACAIHPVKPRQCRAFPNLWNFPGFETICRARAVALDEEAYHAAIRAATGVDLAPPGKADTVDRAKTIQSVEKRAL